MSGEFRFNVSRLQERRVEKGYTLDRLALVTGVPLHKLKAIERYEHATTYARARRIASVLKIDIEELRA